MSALLFSFLVIPKARLLEEMLQKIRTLPETQQNRIALDVIRSIEKITQQPAKKSGNSLSQMLLLPILEEDELTIFERG
ncbi:MAG: hypothetical protein AAGG51_23165 [Cyanobacteria bacterium P01_G01_bin.54]